MAVVATDLVVVDDRDRCAVGSLDTRECVSCNLEVLLDPRVVVLPCAEDSTLLVILDFVEGNQSIAPDALLCLSDDAALIVVDELVH